METTLDTQPNTRKRDAHLSKGGKWRSFPKVPHLLQYVSNGNYYGRIKVSDKIIRESSDTDIWTTAKLRLVDFLKEHGESKPKVDTPVGGFMGYVGRYRLESKGNNRAR